MKNIKLDCFNKNDLCQVTSVDKSFLISNPLEREFILEIFNHQSSQCTIKTQSINALPNNDLTMANLKTANLTIIKQGELLFQDDLSVFFTKEIFLGSIAGNSSASYSFFIDLLDLILQEKKLSFNFDLLFDFDCEETTKNVDQVKNETEDLERKTKRADVLSASSSVRAEATSSNSFFKPSFFLFLLSSLFVIIFFVIMKIINGQKKKK